MVTSFDIRGYMEKILEVKNLHKNFKNFKVLSDVNFTIYKGDIACLVGVNGSGKSTLLECILGIQKPSCGEIIGLDNFKEEIGYVSQNFSHFLDLTVLENVLYFANLYDINQERVEEVLNICFLSERKSFIVKKLSGGYKQLLSLAIALLHKPKFLILDEPTSAMDPMFRTCFWKIVHDFNKGGGTVLIVTHFSEEILECSRLIILSKGQVSYDKDILSLCKSKNISKIIEIIKENTDGLYYG